MKLDEKASVSNTREVFLGIIKEGLLFATTLGSVITGAMKAASIIWQAIIETGLNAATATALTAVKFLGEQILKAFKKITDPIIQTINLMIQGLNRFRTEQIKLLDPIDINPDIFQNLDAQIQSAGLCTHYPWEY